jgi:hypothetical protein
VRKLAREAVIFMLVSMGLVSLGGFIWECESGSRGIRLQLNELKQACLALPSKQPGRFVRILSDDRKTSLGECYLVFGNSPGPEFRDQSSSSGLSPEDEMAYRRTMLEGERIKSQQNLPYAQIAFWSLVSGLYAFLGGLAIWIFYRMAWFAVKG